MLGFTLSEIAQIIAEKQSGQSPCRNVREIVRRRLVELDRRMKEMRRHRNALAQALSEWDEIGDRKGHVCGLIESAAIKDARPATQKLKRKKK
jgi:DNA-binding transcriptional MerR regulator